MQRNVSLIIDDVLISNLIDTAMNRFPNEYGGFLLGKYSDNADELKVSKYILPKYHKSQPCSFERSINGLENEFSNTSEYYVGEWHTHPNGASQYSSTDLNAMIQISNHENVTILNPILLIISLNKKGLVDLSIYLFDKGKLYEYKKD